MLRKITVAFTSTADFGDRLEEGLLNFSNSPLVKDGCAEWLLNPCRPMHNLTFEYLNKCFSIDVSATNDTVSRACMRTALVVAIKE